MNVNKLRSMMALNGDTGNSLAEALGLSPQRFSAKINERNGAEFNQGEIMTIKERYDLSAEDIDSIFFTAKVS
jgi:hypothetical protein